MTEGPDAGKQVGRLSLSVILEHFQRGGADKTFLCRLMGVLKLLATFILMMKFGWFPSFALSRLSRRRPTTLLKIDKDS